MGGVLRFPAADVRKLIEHARRCDEHAPLFSHLLDPAYLKPGETMPDSGFMRPEQVDTSRIPAHLQLVGDRGVYLLSSGRPNMAPAEGAKEAIYVVYAEGINPNVDPDYYETKRMVFGGDDGAELLALEDVEKMLASDEVQYLCIRLTPEAMELYTLV